MQHFLKGNIMQKQNPFIIEDNETVIQVRQKTATRSVAEGERSEGLPCG